MKKLAAVDYAFLTFLLVLVSLYAIHFLSFTLFDGFATFSNDAATYILLAQKWSPFHVPTDAIVQTYAAQQYPPAFPWLLAATGASNSLWSGHLLVSSLMLLSIILLGWIVYRRVGASIAGIVTVALCLLPGVLVSSMGILSENLYLLTSLCVYLVYSHIEQNRNVSWLWFLALAVSLSILILTRTIGIAFIAAALMVSLIQRSQAGRQRAGIILAIATSVLAWFSWGLVDPQTDGINYQSQIHQFFSVDKTIQENFAFLANTMQTNSIRILSAWNHYLTLHQTGFLYFIFPAGLFLVCLVSTGLRAAKLKVDALYLFAYLAIILVWPFPEEMIRFMHPVVFFLFLQPVFLLGEQYENAPKPGQKAVIFIVGSALVVNSLMVNFRLAELQNIAAQRNPALVNTYELYASDITRFDLMTAEHFIDVTNYMLKSAEFVPAEGTVATTKPVNYALLTEIRAVDLVNTVDTMQQLCNLKMMDVDMVLVSALVSGLNWEGHSNADKYHDVASKTWKLEGGASKSFAYAIMIDKTKLEARLRQEDYDCQSYQVYQ